MLLYVDIIQYDCYCLVSCQQSAWEDVCHRSATPQTETNMMHMKKIQENKQFELEDDISYITTLNNDI